MGKAQRSPEAWREIKLNWIPDGVFTARKGTREIMADALGMRTYKGQFLGEICPDPVFSRGDDG